MISVLVGLLISMYLILLFECVLSMLIDGVCVSSVDDM